MPCVLSLMKKLTAGKELIDVNDDDSDDDDVIYMSLV